ncbi:hypothetical protein BaRGS_00002166 [Batillaria attramentaria]|uniref:C1q domain-containing protein n=1 Tax=Batillaria attramentaria TaxID=370345 RepID=A0ABD0M5I4_9CAEN
MFKMWSAKSVLFLLVATASLKVCSAESNRRHARSDDPAPLEALVHQQAQAISQQQAELTALKTLVNKLQARTETKVAFQVRFSAAISVDVTNHQTLVFDVVELNQGGAYDKDTGFFTAPVSGLYQFHVHLAHTPPGRVQVFIVRNGREVAEVESSGDDAYMDRSSNSVVVQLSPGDKVWVRRDNGDVTKIQGGYRTSFSGILVVPFQP